MVRYFKRPNRAGNMLRDRLVGNLRLLCEKLNDYAVQNQLTVPAAPLQEVAQLSQALFLAHSTSSAKFAVICETGRLISRARRAAITGQALSDELAVVRLGTAECVFFYVAPFRFPNTGCGLLFARSLEEHYRAEGTASPFDSGGLASKLSWPDPNESAQHFLARHELPIPDHRDYLLLSLGVLFAKLTDYIEGIHPSWAGPCGLTGGDCRMWTHEVRIPADVELRSGHLQAVFAPVGRIAADPKIGRLFEWCQRERVDRVTFNTSRGNDFETLRRECVQYIRGKFRLQ